MIHVQKYRIQQVSESYLMIWYNIINLSYWTSFQIKINKLNQIQAKPSSLLQLIIFFLKHPFHQSPHHSYLKIRPISTYVELGKRPVALRQVLQPLGRQFASAYGYIVKITNVELLQIGETGLGCIDRIYLINRQIFKNTVRHIDFYNLFRTQSQVVTKVYFDRLPSTSKQLWQTGLVLDRTSVTRSNSKWTNAISSPRSEHAGLTVDFSIAHKMTWTPTLTSSRKRKENQVHFKAPSQVQLLIGESEFNINMQACFTRSEDIGATVILFEEKESHFSSLRKSRDWSVLLQYLIVAWQGHIQLLKCIYMNLSPDTYSWLWLYQYWLQQQQLFGNIRIHANLIQQCKVFPTMQEQIPLPNCPNQSSQHTLQSHKIGLAILNPNILYQLPQSKSQLQLITQIIHEFQHSIKYPDVKLPTHFTIPHKGFRNNVFTFICGELVDVFQYIDQWGIEKMILNKKFATKSKKHQMRQPLQNMMQVRQLNIPLTKIAHIKFPKLKVIVLRCVSDKKIPAFKHAVLMKQLEEIDIQSGQLEDVGNMCAFDGLRKINLNKNKISTTEGLEKMNMSELKILSIANNNLKGLVQLSHLTVPKLQILDLHNNKITRLVVSPSPNNSLSHLKILNLCHNLIQSIESLACADTSSLELLNLSNNKISNIRVLGRINFGSIKEINLQSNIISQYGALSHLNKDKKVQTNLFIMKGMNRKLLKPFMAKLPLNTIINWKTNQRATLLNQLFGRADKPVAPPSPQVAFLNKINPKLLRGQLLTDISSF